MSLRQRIEDDLKTELKARDKEKLSALRMVKARVQEKQVELRGKKGPEAKLSDDDVMDVVSAYAKQRRDSIDSYEKGGREDLAAKERSELQIISAYLPQQMGEDEVAAIVAAIEAAWPEPAPQPRRPPQRTEWRYSGRWWSEGRLPSRWS